MAFTVFMNVAGCGCFASLCGWEFEKGVLEEKI
jgi:hypothetical protein